MRRLRILLYWLFHSKYNIKFTELLQFLMKPKVDVIAKRFIKSIILKEFYEVKFAGIDETLYWPSNFSINGINQITAETFDVKDWHYYQKEHTQIEDGEILLDIGTAEGLFPLTVVHKCKHIYLVEPSSSFAAALTKTFEAFPDKVTLFKTAIGNTEGQIGFDENSLMGQVSQASSSQIPITKIDTLIGAQRKITYLKADLEGFEYEMLKGAEITIKTHRPKIAITTYHEENDYNEIISLIKSYVPEYKFFVKGIYGEEPKPVMVHFWI